MDRQPDEGGEDDLTDDEATANEARRLLRKDGIVAIEPDERIGVMLAPGERVVAVRRSVSLERRMDSDRPGPGMYGDLYVTTSRIVHLGKVPVEVPIRAIQDAVIGAGAVRLIVDDGRALEIHTGDPHVLRVQIAAVREAARIAAGDGKESTGTSEG